MKLDKLIMQKPGKRFYRDGDYLIKLFDENYSKENVLNEALNQARIESLGLNIPRVHEVAVIDGKWAIRMDYIEGETLEDMMKRDPGKREEYLGFFISLQREIHTKKNLYLPKFKDKTVSKIMASGLDASTRYDLCNRLNAMPMHNHVCHGDFNPSNVIITGDGKPFILDWAHVSQGNATADAAKTYLVLKVDLKSDLADEYAEAFCEAAGVGTDYLREWIPLIAASQLKRCKNEEDRKNFMKFVEGEENAYV